MNWAREKTLQKREDYGSGIEKTGDTPTDVAFKFLRSKLTATQEAGRELYKREKKMLAYNFWDLTVNLVLHFNS